MKTLLFCLLMSVLYNPSNNDVQSSTPHAFKPTDSSRLVVFETDVQPIFTSHCNPCHFPGGKMYEKLPFDKAQTILDHEAGILKRIKAENEVSMIKEFIAQQKNK